MLADPMFCNRFLMCSRHFHNDVEMIDLYIQHSHESTLGRFFHFHTLIVRKHMFLSCRNDKNQQNHCHRTGDYAVEEQHLVGCFLHSKKNQHNQEFEEEYVSETSSTPFLAHQLRDLQSKVMKVWYQ